MLRELAPASGSWLRLVRCMVTRLTLAPLLLVLFASCDNWSDAQVAETKRRGDIVCRAIEAYRARNSKVPSDLKKPQPDFLREIPQPTVGKLAWTYETYQSGSPTIFQSRFGESRSRYFRRSQLKVGRTIPSELAT